MVWKVGGGEIGVVGVRYVCGEEEGFCVCAGEGGCEEGCLGGLLACSFS